jgi:hypothetical protein
MTDLTPFSSASGNAPKPASPQADSSAALLGPPIETETRRTDSLLQVWMHRTSVFLFVLISAVAGVLLIILPWTPEWTDNYLLLSFPALRSVVSNGFFRGLCSGLGLLDIWIGFWEALHYHEQQ